MRELVKLAQAAEVRAREVGVKPDIHLDDFIFRFLIENQAFDCVDSAVKYYFHDARKSATQLLDLINEVKGKNTPCTMLEFASGYGCVTRHLRTVLPNVHSTACDIHTEAVRFIRENLDAEAISSCVDPDTFGHQSEYDVVFALSFFSHMPRSSWSRWLVALYAAVAPGGTLIFTTHGQQSAKLFGDPILDADGYWFLADSEQKDLDVATYGQTIVTESFVRQEIQDKLATAPIIAREGFWWGHQDCYVVHKATALDERLAAAWFTENSHTSKVKPKLEPAMATLLNSPTILGFAMNEIERRGKCNLEVINKTQLETATYSVPKGAPLHLSGWAIDELNLRLPNSVIVYFADPGASEYFAVAQAGLQRPDVMAYFKVSDALLGTGFQLLINSHDIPVGEYKLAVILRFDDATYICESGRSISVQQQAVEVMSP